MRTSRIGAAALAVCAVVLATGCGSDDSTTSAVSTSTSSVTGSPFSEFDNDTAALTRWVDQFRATMPALAEGRSDGTLRAAALSTCRDIADESVSDAAIDSHTRQRFTWNGYVPTASQIKEIEYSLLVYANNCVFPSLGVA